MDIRVMVVDPDAPARARLTAALRQSGMVVAAEVASGEEALRLVRAMAPDVVVIDATLPGMGPVAAVRRIRELAPRPVEIVATAPISDTDRLGRLVAVGAAAYVVKDDPAQVVMAAREVARGSGLLSPEASRPVLEEMRRRFDQEQARNVDLEKTVAQLQALSVTDSLTGLKNHGYFFDRLAEELERARRYDRELSVVVGDLDDFKGVNDLYGHAAGDAVLRQMGKVLRTHLREVDIACRVGGEEFAVLMPETGAEGALHAAERLRRAVEEASVPLVGRVRMSLGVSVFPDHGQARNELFESADRALYRAKRDGKNQVRIAGDAAPRSAGAGPATAAGPVVGALLGALRMRAPELADFSIRVAELATSIGTAMELRAAELEELRLAGLLHDVGMLGIPDRVLFKAGPLDDQEWRLVRGHPEAGFELVVEAVHDVIAEAVRAHHESFDGTGYPRQLAGDEIPILARVVRAADTYVAITSRRPHRPARSPDVALTELRRQSGTSFDPAVVATLEDMLAADPA
ncbi:MAG: diguanylate cyclase, partial [Acidimicrobiia bacterium]